VLVVFAPNEISRRRSNKSHSGKAGCKNRATAVAGKASIEVAAVVDTAARNIVDTAVGDKAAAAGTAVGHQDAAGKAAVERFAGGKGGNEDDVDFAACSRGDSQNSVISFLEPLPEDA